MAGWWDDVLNRQSPDSAVVQWSNNFGYQHPSVAAATAAAAGPSLEQQGWDAVDQWGAAGGAPSDWWRQPGLSSGAVDMIVGGGQGVPDWATYPGSGNLSAQDFYTTYMGKDERYRDDYLSDLQAEYQVWADKDRARQEGIDRREGAVERLHTGYEAWEADPYRTATMEGLLERSQPGYSIVSPQQQGEWEAQIAQQRAMQRMLADASAAGRGVSSGGAHLSRNTAIDAYAAAGGRQVQARIAQADDEAQARATELMGSLAGRNRELDLHYQDAITRAEGAIAGLEAGSDAEAQDYAVWSTLDLAFQDFDMQTELLDQARLEYEQGKEFSWEDLVEMMTNLGGTGFYDWVGGMFSGGGGSY